MSNIENTPANFSDLGLSAPILEALNDVGYETPSPIQLGAIPPLLEGRDLLGQAQTGTGKTAAFALPLLQRLDPSKTHPQLLILAPTRELALQVSTACEKYSKHLTGVRILSIYGGQGYDEQLRGLRRGAHVVIGTPGRVMDHIRRGTLALDRLQTLVLDEADEMLRMGFIDDVEWILQHTPAQRQIALFSATMPPVIRRIADNYLTEPAVIKIESKTATASTIRQRVWTVRGMTKLTAMTRLLELQEHEGALVFVRTKNATEELAEQLTKAGFPAAALHGDIAQAQRERVVEKLKSGELDIVIATDVVARGLDVERITHVINYDIPYDAESYIHRIGRTGRAGRDGDAILFAAPREQRLLQQIERTTRSPIEQLILPTAKQLNELRVERLKKQISIAAEASDLEQYLPLIESLVGEQELSPVQVAAAILKMMHKDKPLFLNEKEPAPATARERRPRDEGAERGKRRPAGRSDAPAAGMQRFWLGVGYQHGVKPGNIVGAIANEASVDSQHIGRIDINETYSTVDLPSSLSPDSMQVLKRARICGQALNIRPWQDDVKDRGADRSGPPKARRRPPTAKSGAPATARAR
ncbi:DEAD/DEAH box helicase [Nitrincola alkalilacustris]|uniref:DEAD/DEAH box helicase n=1 Tax=Nitrincola alkalilacustris TaxID=1571224 RepID=UPI00124DA8AF|nr:DEAD/DEAH box helicase [Nitrincola alkalilacustris]